ncbi:ammonia-forming cytochrome c nitrite reductase subunit c552 [Carboxydocella sp. ULO1]|uniref:ammonia-forming cytochrome c nitrite reductase subunit c552 n=1 Tax=Carboxydocella sp. ULO1 TaxID=1926599 RepID=UPI0009C622E5|nr:ammonia-forming cytochrome c nitrite reductase subunit c552 [Carboxydocella sp. ULO1]GAW29129.1 cytochrome c552 [Carboxydocella sp. ULO1]
MRTKGIILLVLAGLVLWAAGCAGPEGPKGPEIKKGAIKEETCDPSEWGKVYPLEYETYQKNKLAERTKYGGSVKYSKFTTEPEIKELFKGYGFSIDYNEERGHVYSLEDIRATKRKKPSASCWTCKSAQVPKLIRDMGDKFFTSDFEEVGKKINVPISCADCHDPETMNLRITRPPFVEAMKERGIDVTKANRQAMRNYVCGQCHVEYYFRKDNKKVVFPWKNGLEPEQIEKYYDQYEGGPFFDWEHPDSKAKLRKVQHPEFETHMTGIHGKAGVTCVDCHMPYLRDKNKVKYSSHWWTSPLKDVERSCAVCHRAQKPEWFKEMIYRIQDRTWALQQRAAQTLVEAHQAVAAAEKAGRPAADLEAARRLIVQAQWRWDWVAAENSRGFHNPDQALTVLGQAIDLANQAIKKVK